MGGKKNMGVFSLTEEIKAICQPYRTSSWESWVIRWGFDLFDKFSASAQNVLPNASVLPSPMVVSPVYSDYKLERGNLQLTSIQSTSQTSEIGCFYDNHRGLMRFGFSLLSAIAWWTQKHISRTLVILHGPFTWSSFYKLGLQILWPSCLLSCVVVSHRWTAKFHHNHTLTPPS